MEEKVINQQVEDALVGIVVMIRNAFMRACEGRPPLGYWTQLDTRMVAAARRTETVGEWITAVFRGLRLDAPTESDSKAITEFSSLCDAHKYHLKALECIEREHSFLIALARDIIEERKAEKAKS